MHKFEGKFNYHGQVFNLWTTAKTESKARVSFLKRLVEKLNLDKSAGYVMLRYHFSDKANYTIKRADHI